jgi:RNA polymerase sigma factor (TIGR02999 family)
MEFDPATGFDRATYAGLRQVAERLLRGERRNHTLVPTDVVHEAWLRVARSRRNPDNSTDTDCDAFDLGLAARVMRQILVDHARRRGAAKRTGTVVARQVRERDRWLVELDAALADLARLDRELAAVVELRFFGGFDLDETARLLSISPRTVKRRWQLAKAWLQREIGDDGGKGDECAGRSD